MTMANPITLEGNTSIVVKGRTTTTKSTTATLTDPEVLGGLVLLTAAVQLTLPAAASTNASADLYISATAAGTLHCVAGFHGGGASYDTLTFAAYEGCHVYSDGANWYLLGCGPGCTLS
jgi:subtilisin family serine protease